MSAITAVLIDLDGTLLDTVPDLAEAANRMRAESGLAPLPVERIAQFVGKGAISLVHRAMTDRLDGRIEGDAFEGARASFYRHYHQTNGVLAVVFDRVPEALDMLRSAGCALACVTNKPREFTLPLLERCGLAARFVVVVAGDDVSRGKPDPEIVLRACAQLKTVPGAARLIGDSANDAAAARAAGMRCLLVQTGYNEDRPITDLAGEDGVDAIVPTLYDAARLIVLQAREA